MAIITRCGVADEELAAHPQVGEERRRRLGLTPTARPGMPRHGRARDGRPEELAASARFGERCTLEPRDEIGRVARMPRERAFVEHVNAEDNRC
ncbi:hypothetical protein GCM10011490_12920 [Pseudoclavibacter endophyticus]|nr:hypothetical protein GCM10011490_12920 [Pseudoclavibacter endophyticus]